MTELQACKKLNIIDKVLTLSKMEPIYYQLIYSPSGNFAERAKYRAYSWAQTLSSRKIIITVNSN